MQILHLKFFIWFKIIASQSIEWRNANWELASRLVLKTPYPQIINSLVVPKLPKPGDKQESESVS